MYGSEHQSRITGFVIGGIAAIIVGILGFMFTAMGGGLFGSQAAAMATAGFFILCGLGGAGLLVAAAVIGGREAFGSNEGKPVQSAENVYIISTLIPNESHDPIYDPDMYDEEDLRCYVQIEFASGRKQEFETNLAVLSTIGEGMRGTITYQGKWLSSFVMTIQPGR